MGSTPSNPETNLHSADNPATGTDAGNAGDIAAPSKPVLLTVPRPTAATAPPDMSAWGPLAIPIFRWLWIASIASNLGTWMQSVGASWLMTLLTPSPILVALMQTATSLPLFLVGLPAGAVADIVDRRKLLLATQGWMLAASAVLGIMTIANLTTEWSLLSLTFLLGLGGAFNAPAWQAIVPELVGPRQVGAAVSLNSVGFNLARSVGPALGGFIVALSGPGAVFLLNAVSYVGVMAVIFIWRRTHVDTAGPPERVFGAIAAGVRYARNSMALQAVLVRSGAFILAASALWALLPVVASRNLGLDAGGYGILLGSLGFGAVIGAVLLPRIRNRASVDTLTMAATVTFGIATLALGYIQSMPLLIFMLILGGMAWMAMMSSLNVAAQGAAPAWVRARALGVYLLVFQGGTALGSFAWGTLADLWGNRAALTMAAGALCLSVAAAWRWKLTRVETLDMTPSQRLEEPHLPTRPAMEDGPVMVTVEYRVPAHNEQDFVRVMQRVGRMRRRTGAYEWSLFKDPAQPDRFLETFLARTWAEHLRQHSRPTMSDERVRMEALTYTEPGHEPQVSHFIATHPVSVDRPQSNPVRRSGTRRK